MSGHERNEGGRLEMNVDRSFLLVALLLVAGAAVLVNFAGHGGPPAGGGAGLANPGEIMLTGIFLLGPAATELFPGF